MRVLLTRPRAQSEELGSVLTGHGIDWSVEPLLRIAPLPWDLGVLAERSAVVLTSANASRELLRVRGISRDLTVYAVGRATAAPLRAAGYSDVHTANGTAASLIDYIRRRVRSDAGRLLHLSGVDIACDLGRDLARFGFAVDRVPVYRAVAAERLEARVILEISKNWFDAGAFLSVRTAAVFCNLVFAAGIREACARMTGIAISGAVAAALEPVGFHRVVVAAAPSQDGIVDAILALQMQRP